MDTPTRLVTALLSTLLAGCVTTLPGPAVELTADCQVVAAGSGGGGRGGGYGGGAPGAEAAPGDLLAQSKIPSPAPDTADGVSSSTGSSDGGGTGSSDGGGRRHSSSDGGAAIAGAVAAAVGAAAFAHYNSPAQVLSREGPVLPAEFSMSCLPVRGFVQRGWPVVIDYVADGSSEVSLEIHLGTGGPAFVQALDGGAGRHFERLDLPQNLPDEPSPALVLVKSRRPGDAGPGRMQLLALGAGPRAVGSSAIDKVDFSPSVVHRRAHQQASYAFYSRSDFNRLVVEVMRVTNAPGEVKVGLVRAFRFDGGVSRGSRFGPRNWDGTNDKDQPSLGPHLLQVRAWVSEDEKSWVTAWSFNAVQVGE